MDSNSISLEDVNAKSSLEFKKSGGKPALAKTRNKLVLSLDGINLPAIKTVRNKGRQHFK